MSLDLPAISAAIDAEIAKCDEAKARMPWTWQRDKTMLRGAMVGFATIGYPATLRLAKGLIAKLSPAHELGCRFYGGESCDCHIALLAAFHGEIHPEGPAEVVARINAEAAG